MSTIDSSTSRSLFLPGKSEKTGKTNGSQLKRNSDSRKAELEVFSKTDSKVDIPDAIKDFSRIKKVADAAPELDNSAKIARLKSEIQAGTYKVDPDAIADRILEQEF